MSLSDASRLILLSAIWGASFLFMRIAVPEFGPISTTFTRIAGAALALLPFLLRPGNRSALRNCKLPLAILGLFNSALPFSLFCWASLHLTSGFCSLLNATTPICTALIGFCWLRIPLTRFQGLGLLVGLVGIAILTGDRLDFSRDGAGWPILAVLGATCCYGFAGHYARTRLAHVPPLTVSAGSLLAATLMVLPLVLLFPPPALPGKGALASALALALLCTALAFLLFFDLLKRNGATAAATVTFIIPVFGILWGALLLQEEVTGRMILGMMIALLGTAFVTRLLPRQRSQPMRPSAPVSSSEVDRTEKGAG